MKKLLLIAGLAIFLFSCSDEEPKQTPTTDQTLLNRSDEEKGLEKIIEYLNGPKSEIKEENRSYSR